MPESEGRGGIASLSLRRRRAAASDGRDLSQMAAAAGRASGLRLILLCALALAGATVGAEPEVSPQDRWVGLARSYAPYILHAVHPEHGRQDLPTRVDFDGDMRGDNNWENFDAFELPPTVYFAVLESESHYFIAYHLFHPRDWSWVRVGLHLTHENDGENLQVVVDKSSGRVVLLFTQAHYSGRVYADPESGFAGGAEAIRGPFTRLDGNGRPAPDGRHVAVFVEAFGHGIYGLADGHAALLPDGTARFEDQGIVFRPAAEGEPIVEPPIDTRERVPYRLRSTTLELWPGLRDGTLIGQGGLFDGPHPYRDSRVTVEVPGYYEADRFSGPFGPDRGISPFAIDFDFDAGTLGALFFDPARRYAERLRVPTPWSTRYIDYPFYR